MVLVPCCQAEMAACLRQGKALQLARTPLAELWRHPLHTRELGSQVTNVLRCLYLEANGYQVTVTELVGWEHSMKNELIIARYTGQKKRSAAKAVAGASRRIWPGTRHGGAVWHWCGGRPSGELGYALTRTQKARKGRPESSMRLAIFVADDGRRQLASMRNRGQVYDRNSHIPDQDPWPVCHA